MFFALHDLFICFHAYSTRQSRVHFLSHDIFVCSQAKSTRQSRAHFSPHDILWKYRLSYRAENRPLKLPARYIETFSANSVVFFEIPENQHHVPLCAICKSDTCSEKLFTCRSAINKYPVVRTRKMKGKPRNKNIISLSYRACGGKKPGKSAQHENIFSEKMLCGSETELNLHGQKEYSEDLCCVRNIGQAAL